MPIEIKHRFSGTVLRTVDADTLSGADLIGAYLNGASLRGANLYEANLRGANLYEANLRGANLTGANLYEANLSQANLYEANLSGANLSGAHLSRTNLIGASLTFANLRGAIIGEDKLDRLLARATRLDGHEFFLFKLQDGPPTIKAGCRWMTIPEYREHVAKEYQDTDKELETLRILNSFEATAEGL